MKGILAVFALCVFLLSSCLKTEAQSEFEPKLVKGVSLVAPSNPFVIEDLKSIEAVNANYVAILPYGFCPKDSPKVIYNQTFQWWGETTKGVIESIDMAKELGFNTMIKPQIWLRHGKYTGLLTFETDAEWKRWEKDYTNFIMDFVKIADSLKVEMFCIGTELRESVKQRPEFWNGLIAKIRQAYNGKLTYAANWDDYKYVPFWNELDFIGIDAYFPITNKSNPNYKTVLQSWNELSTELAAFTNKHERQILFTEFGYTSTSNALSEPWTWSEKEKLNLSVQKMGYDAFFESAWQENWLAGIFIWKWYPDDNKVDKEDKHFSPQNKPAEESVRKAFKP